jgi:hypothetical protein
LNKIKIHDSIDDDEELWNGPGACHFIFSRMVKIEDILSWEMPVMKFEEPIL